MTWFATWNNRRFLTDDNTSPKETTKKPSQQTNKILWWQDWVTVTEQWTKWSVEGLLDLGTESRVPGPKGLWNKDY